MHRRWSWLTAACLALACGRAAADPLAEATELRRRLQYAAAQEKLGIALPDLTGDERARALLLLAWLSTDHKEARRLLLEASRQAPAAETRRLADLELARLDYARGNYRSVLNRLRPHASQAEAAALLAESSIAVGEPQSVRDFLQPIRQEEIAVLLGGWATLEGGDAQRALPSFEQLAKQRDSDHAATALLWKAECESALGLRDRALETAGQLRNRYPETPEARMVQSVLGQLRTPSPEEADTRPARIVLQVGAFEDRANALRYQARLAREIQRVQVSEVGEGVQRIYRVQVGPFETRDAAEAYARAELEPRGIAWRVARPEGPGGP